MSSSSSNIIGREKVVTVGTKRNSRQNYDDDEQRKNESNEPSKQRQKRKRSCSRDPIDLDSNRRRSKYNLRSGKVDLDAAPPLPKKIKLEIICQSQENNKNHVVNNKAHNIGHVEVDKNKKASNGNRHQHHTNFSLKQVNNTKLESDPCSSHNDINERDVVESSSIYHEQQQQQLCGLHALNAVLQGPYFVKEDLFTIARQIDDETKALLQQIGPSNDISNQYFEKNSNAEGNFTLQVLQIALGRHNIEMIHHQSNRPIARNFLNGTLIPKAFICNSHGKRGNHWYAVRKIGNNYYNLDSLSSQNGPRIIESFNANDCFILFGNLPGENNN